MQSVILGMAVVLCAWLVVGCDASFSIGSSAPPTSQVETMTLPLTAMRHVYICDKTGNVTLKADSQAKAVTMEIKKTVYVQNSADPSPRFQALKVSTQNIANSACDWLPKKGSGSSLVVSATSPDDGNTLNGQKDAVHLTIVFPSSMVSRTSPLSVRIEAGNNIDLSGFAASMTLLSVGGNVQAEDIALAPNSTFHSQGGNVVFSGSLAGSMQDMFQSDTGNVSLTLPASTNVSVDADAPTGHIENTFAPGTVDKGAAGATLKGPLNPGMGAVAPGVLKLRAFAGNIVINKA